MGRTGLAMSFGAHSLEGERDSWNDHPEKRQMVAGPTAPKERGCGCERQSLGWGGEEESGNV